MTPREAELIYQARLTYIRKGIKEGKSGNEILRNLQRTPLKMRRQAFQEFIRDIRQGRVPVKAKRLRVVYSPSRFIKDLEYKFQGHVLDRWRREVHADVEFEEEIGSPPGSEHRTRFNTIFLGVYTKTTFIALGVSRIKGIINDRLRDNYGYTPDWTLIGIWANKLKVSESVKRARG